ncbi:MAG: hypothetical protein EBY17_31205 [Acidobacteriia bacterium]|nr:hypothetical protein [Terriglobia bacterium]
MRIQTLVLLQSNEQKLALYNLQNFVQEQKAQVENLVLLLGRTTLQQKCRKHDEKKMKLVQHVLKN